MLKNQNEKIDSAENSFLVRCYLETEFFNYENKIYLMGCSKKIFDIFNA